MAAEEVCASDDVERAAVAEQLLSLVDRHLVRPVTTLDGRRRFRLLETVREFAAERLDAGPERDDVQDRHVAFVSRWAAELAAHSEGPESAAWLTQAVAEADNLRAALRALEQRGDHEALLQLAVDSMVVWFEAGHEDEGERRLTAALAAAGPSAPARAIGLTYWAWLRATRDRAGAAAAALEALDLARSAGDPLVEAFAQQTLGDTLDDPAAAWRPATPCSRRPSGRRADRSATVPPRRMRCAVARARASLRRGRTSHWTRRSRWQRDALRLAELEGDRRITAVNAARLAHLHLLVGDTAAAEVLVDRARVLVSAHVTARWEDIVAFAEAELAMHLGRFAEAERQLTVLVDRAVAGGRQLHARLGSLLLADLFTHLARLDAAAQALDRLAGMRGALDEHPAAAEVEVRRARLDRLAGRRDTAGERLDAVEGRLPADRLPPAAVLVHVESDPAGSHEPGSPGT